MLRNQEILCLSNTHWECHPGCMQEIMSRLARTNKILYVNRPLTLVSPFSGNEEISGLRQIVEAALRPYERKGNLCVATPPMILPLRYLRISETINSKILSLWLEKTVHRVKIRPSIVWTYLPESLRIVKRISRRLSLYHSVDDHSAANFWWNSQKTIRTREIELLKDVDLVIATSRNLQRILRQANPHCYFIPNAGNYGLFSKAAFPETQIPSEIADIKKPLVGYFGTINSDRLNLEWLEYAATKSKYSFVFIGRKPQVRFDVSRLTRLNNVHFFGFKEQAELPGYLKAVDVCIMPSVNTRMNDSVFPLKLFEYLAAGKPVVATRTKELSCYDQMVSLVGSREEFLAAITTEIKNDNVHSRNTRMEFASNNTWESRVDEISKVIEEFTETNPKSYRLY